MQYIIPGYLSLMIFLFALSKKADIKNIMIFSCIISYVLMSFIALIRIKWFKKLPNNAVINSGLSIILGIVIACLIAIISQRKWFKNITIKLFHKTFNDDIWRDIFDLENGSNLKVYVKGKDYYIIGHLKNYEEKGNDSWIALNAFTKFDKETNKIYKNEPSYSDRKDIIITLRFADIDHIEIF